MGLGVSMFRPRKKKRNQKSKIKKYWSKQEEAPGMVMVVA